MLLWLELVSEQMKHALHLQQLALQAQATHLRHALFLVQLKSEADNIWAIIDLDACTVEQRWQFASAQSWLRTPG